MKTRIVGELTQEKEIDWSKKQVVSGLDYVLITTGEHDETSFSAFLLYCNNKHDFDHKVSRGWVKKTFKPITEPITIEFSND